jgi:hypothetical protein
MVKDGQSYLVEVYGKENGRFMTGVWREDMNVFVAPLIDEEHQFYFTGTPYIEVEPEKINDSN